jgi:DNA-binding transcriptional ArsR family regulator/type II secretory pathway predicted ATPase ExeA
LSDQELLDGFIVRGQELEQLLAVVDSNTGEPNQHLLVLGPRGFGKSTLVNRVAVEIRRSDRAWLPLVLPEENYGVATVGELWLETLGAAARETGDSSFSELAAELRGESDEQRLAERGLAALRELARETGKRLMVVVENLDMMLDEQWADDDEWALRKVLLNEPQIMLLATALRTFEGVDDGERALFECLRRIELQPLSTDEVQQLWKGEASEAVRILTGGNPRLVAMLASFSTTRSLERLVDDLLELMDENTAYLKANVESLPARERRVFSSLADLWSPSTAAQVAARARVPVNTASSLLSRLEKRGAVRVERVEGRTKYYELVERLYGLYHLSSSQRTERHGAAGGRVHRGHRFGEGPSGLDRRHCSGGGSGGVADACGCHPRALAPAAGPERDGEPGGGITEAGVRFAVRGNP